MSSYATPSDFATFGLPAKVTAGVDNSVIQSHLDAASTYADTCFAARTQSLPLTAPYPLDVVQRVCEMAAYTLMAAVIGYNPDQHGDKAIQDRAEAAQKYFDEIKNGERTPNFDAATAAEVDSAADRGWFDDSSDESESYVT